MIFSKRLKQLRNNHGLTQEQLGKIVGKNRSTIAGYESEDKQPDYDTLDKFAEYFKVSTDYLLGRIDIRDPYDIKAVASNHDENEWTDEELEDIEKFKEYLKIRRNQKNKQ